MVLIWSIFTLLLCCWLLLKSAAKTIANCAASCAHKTHSVQISNKQIRMDGDQSGQIDRCLCGQ